MPNHLLALFGSALALLAFAAPAQAYWEYGHESVARIAWLQMQPGTRARVAALLRQGKLLETPGCPVATLEQASVWADCVKPLGDRFTYAYSWHYQNVDVCGAFDLKAACKDGNCVSAQIERNARLLADHTVPVRERVMALAFLTHFVGDLHQPMHAGDHADLGGNKVAASYGVIGGRTNLHSIWDGWLAERAISTPPAGRRHCLRKSLKPSATGSPAVASRIGAGRCGGRQETWPTKPWSAIRAARPRPSVR